jgi:hypothetical protein
MVGGTQQPGVNLNTGPTNPSQAMNKLLSSSAVHAARYAPVFYSNLIFNSQFDFHADLSASIAELLAMIAAAYPPLAPHRPRPVLETEEWLFESATEFIEALEKYYAERATQIKRVNH